VAVTQTKMEPTPQAEPKGELIKRFLAPQPKYEFLVSPEQRFAVVNAECIKEVRNCLAGMICIGIAFTVPIIWASAIYTRTAHGPFIHDFIAADKRYGDTGRELCALVFVLVATVVGFVEGVLRMPVCREFIQVYDDPKTYRLAHMGWLLALFMTYTTLVFTTVNHVLDMTLMLPHKIVSMQVSVAVMLLATHLIIRSGSNNLVIKIAIMSLLGTVTALLMEFAWYGAPETLHEGIGQGLIVYAKLLSFSYPVALMVQHVCIRQRDKADKRATHMPLYSSRK
jgi:hypothetical protein